MYLKTLIFTQALCTRRMHGKWFVNFRFQCKFPRPCSMSLSLCNVQKLTVIKHCNPIVFAAGSRFVGWSNGTPFCWQTFLCWQEPATEKTFKYSTFCWNSKSNVMPLKPSSIYGWQSLTFCRYSADSRLWDVCFPCSSVLVSCPGP